MPTIQHASVNIHTPRERKNKVLRNPKHALDIGSIKLVQGTPDERSPHCDDTDASEGTSTALMFGVRMTAAGASEISVQKSQQVGRDRTDFVEQQPSHAQGFHEESIDVAFFALCL